MSNYENYINTNCHKFNESILLSEIAWNNIMISFMNKEYNILKEDSNPKSNKILDTVKEWFKKIIEWCQALVLKIREFLEKITIIKTVKTMLEYTKKNIINLEYNCNKLSKNNHKIEIHNWNKKACMWGTDLPEMSSISVIFNNAIKKINNSEMFKNNDKFNEYLEKNLSFKCFIDEGERYFNFGTNKNTLSYVLKQLTMINLCIKYIGAEYKLINDQVKKINSLSKQSMNSNDESTIKKNKENIVTLKEKIIHKNKILSQYYRVVACYCSDLGKIISACKYHDYNKF